MSHALPFSAAIVMTTQRTLADRLRTQLNQAGIPFVHTPTDQVHALELLQSDEEAVLIVDCDELGGICHQMLEDISFTGQSRLRPVLILVDETCLELNAMVDEFDCCELLSGEDMDLEASIQTLGKRFARSLSIREKYRAACFLRAAGQLADAESILLDLMEADAGCPAIAVELADIMREQGRIEESVAILRETLEAHEGHLAALQSLAKNYLQKKRWGQAIHTLEEALERNPQHTLRRFMLAKAWYDQGAYAPALEEYQAVLTIRGEHDEAVQGFISSALLAENYQALIDASIAQKKPQLFASQCNRQAFQDAQAEEWQRALVVLNFALQQLKDFPTVFAKIAFNLGVTLHRQGDKEAACRCFALTAVIDPSLDKAKSNWLAAAPQFPDFDLPEAQDAVRSLLTGEPLAINAQWPLEFPVGAAARQSL